MDLINKLQNLKETTQSREVKDLCEAYISELKNGNTSINESQVVEAIEAKVENTISPMEALRNEELDRSKARAKMLAESWGGIGKGFSKTSGSYVDGVKDEERSTSEIESRLNEAIGQMAQFDKSAESFVISNQVEKLGILESILDLSKKGIYEHGSFKILCENYVNLIKNKALPEYWVAEAFISDFSNYAWDSSVKAVVNRVTESCNTLRPEIEASKALYQIANAGSSDFYSPVKESISKWLVSEGKSVAALSRDLRVWSFNPIVKNLINTLTVLESNGSKMNIPTINGNSEVKKIYSPVLVEGNKTIFGIGKTLFEGSSEGVRKLSNRDISIMDKDFLGLLETFYSEAVKTDERGIHVYAGDTRISIVNENDETKIYLNNDLANFADYNQLAKLISFRISRGLGTNESKVISDIIRLYENFDKIVELDFAKSVISKVYEGASVSLIKWDGKIFLQRVNEAMRENSLFAVNGSQAVNMVREFLKYDISEGLTEFLDGEKRVKSIMFNDRKKVIENISIVESEMQKIESLVATNPLYKGSKQLSDAYSLLEKELQVLKSKWSTINAELDSIENNSISINDDLLEDSKFTVGDYVKVKENGNTGKIISVDTTSGSYTVLLDSGKTGDFGVEDIIDLEDAFNKDSDENAEAGEEVKESNAPLAKAPSAGKPVHGKTPAQVLKASTAEAPSAKTQDQDGKKDVENLKDANLEEAPDSKNKLTNYEVNDEIGYNLEESQDSLVAAPQGKPKGTNMATEWEKSGLKAMNLASAPGKEEGKADYKVEAPEPKADKNADIDDLNTAELAEAPGSGKSKMDEASDLSKLDTAMATAPGAQVGDSGYKTKIDLPKASSPEIDNLDTAELVTAPEKGAKVPAKDTTDPNLATSPGKVEGDAGYDVEYLDPKSSKNADIDNLDTAELAEAPSKGADGEVGYELNSEMGYNLDETLANIRDYIMKNKDSEEVQKMLSDLNEGFERPSPELKKN